jgi:phage repressor protein C with HTH and peptisase S24 domain
MAISSRLIPSTSIMGKLAGQIVVAWNVEKGLIVSRLMRFDHTDVLVSDRREYESISLAPESKWRIIGKVLWWTGRARYR